jgi:structural maintenance of chromosome 4
MFIGSKKPAFVSQGEVESIALMPPKGKTEGEEGLLEYLEDIIGTNIYKDTIEAKVKELEELNEERQERLNRVKIVEKERNALEGRKNEAEAYLRTENNLTKHRNKLWQFQGAKARHNVEVLNKEVAALEETLINEQEKYRGLQEAVAEAEAKFEVMKREYETLGEKAIEAQEELAKAEKEDIRLSENLKHLKTKVKKLAKQLEKDKHSIVELETTISNCADDVKKATKELAQLNVAKEKEEKILDEIRDSLKGRFGNTRETESDLISFLATARQNRGLPDSDRKEAARTRAVARKDQHGAGQARCLQVGAGDPSGAYRSFEKGDGAGQGRRGADQCYAQGKSWFLPER